MSERNDNLVLEAIGLSKNFRLGDGSIRVLADADIRLKEASSLSIQGSSGCGKTTLLNCVSTIDHVTSGKIIVNDIDVTKLRGNHLNRFRRKELGFIFQDFNLLDTLTAYENISLALTIQRVSPAKIHKSVK